MPANTGTSETLADYRTFTYENSNSKMKQLTKITNTDKVLKGVSTQTLITAILGILEIVSFSIMSRLLTEKDFGYYAAMLAIVTVFKSFAETGIGASIVQRKNLDKYYMNNAFSMNLLFGIIISFTLFLSSDFLSEYVADETMAMPLRIISITLLCNCLSSVNISLLQRNLQFVKIGIVNITSLVTTTLVAIVLALKGYGYYAILARAVLESFLILFLSYLMVNMKYKFVWDIQMYRQIFGFGGWLMASAVFRNLAAQIDRLLMTSLFSIQTLGLYTRPKEFISSLAGKTNTIFDTVLFPVLSTLQDKKQQLQRSFNSACYFLNIMGMLMSVVLFCNGELIIRIFLGEKWLHVLPLFSVLSFYPVLLINGRMGDIFLRAMAKTKQQFLFRVGQLVFAVAFILIGYRWGIIALAISVMASYASITCLKIGYVIGKMGISYSMIGITILHSYRFVLFILPVYVVCCVACPHNWTGNIIQAVVLLLSLFVLFLLFPSFVGKHYKNGGYFIVKNFIKSKLKMQ